MQAYTIVERRISDGIINPADFTVYRSMGSIVGYWGNGTRKPGFFAMDEATARTLLPQVVTAFEQYKTKAGEYSAVGKEIVLITLEEAFEAKREDAF